jgi:hypothetical protein
MIRTRYDGALRWRLVAAAALLVSMPLLASCGGDGGSAGASSKDQAATSTTSGPGDATISVFEVPTDVACGGKTSTSVHVKYATTHAKSQQLIVDGRPVDGTKDATGELDVPVHCDPLPHTFVLIALDSRGRPTALQKIVNTSL